MIIRIPKISIDFLDFERPTQWGDFSISTGH